MKRLPGTEPHPLVGGYRMQAWGRNDGRHVRVPADGAEVKADGTMIGIMGPGDRPRSERWTSGPARYATFIVYGGRYLVEAETVTSPVEMSLFPNWTGTTQRRRWRIVG